MSTGALLTPTQFADLDKHADADEARVTRLIKDYIRHGPDIYSPDEIAVLRELIRTALRLEYLEAQR
jgi:hypothetical protein